MLEKPIKVQKNTAYSLKVLEKHIILLGTLTKKREAIMSEVFHKLKEVGEILKLSRSALNKNIHSGELKAFKIGSVWRVADSDLDAFIAKRRGK